MTETATIPNIQYYQDALSINHNLSNANHNEGSVISVKTTTNVAHTCHHTHI